MILFPNYYRGEVPAIVGAAVGVGDRLIGGVVVAMTLLRLAITCIFFFRAARR